MKTFKRVCLVILFLPILIPAASYSDLSSRELPNMRKMSPSQIVVVSLYWVILLTGAVVVVVAYLNS